LLLYAVLTSAYAHLLRSSDILSVAVFVEFTYQTQTQNTLFSLGMLTYTYERQDIIQIALKSLPG
jgi:hypothetical protein